MYQEEEAIGNSFALELECLLQGPYHRLGPAIPKRGQGRAIWVHDKTRKWWNGAGGQPLYGDKCNHKDIQRTTRVHMEGYIYVAEISKHR